MNLLYDEKKKKKLPPTKQKTKMSNQYSREPITDATTDLNIFCQMWLVSSKKAHKKELATFFANTTH
jgi:hypothetical protein